MQLIRTWKYRIYPSKAQAKKLDGALCECKELWNSLLGYTKEYYKETGRFPKRQQLYPRTKESALFSQAAQNVADRLSKSIQRMLSRKKAGIKAGFPRFKSLARMKSFTYPQFGFKFKDRLELFGIGKIQIKKHREIKGRIKTLTLYKTPTGKWFAIFTSCIATEEPTIKRNRDQAVGIDLGIETFAHLSDGSTLPNPRHLKKAGERLTERHRKLSRKKKGSKNRVKARLKLAATYEKIANARRDFLHKASKTMVKRYSFIAMEKLKINRLSKGFLAKSILDCAWAEFARLLAYKAEEAGCELVLVNPAGTTQECSQCGSVKKKTLAERWHSCACGASMHRDLNAAINILKRSCNESCKRGKQSFLRATAGTAVSQACGEEAPTHYKNNEHASSMKQEALPLAGG